MVFTAALIGLGNIAWKYDANKPNNLFALSQAGAMLRDPRVRLAGGCSPDAADRAGFSVWSSGVPVFDHVQDMLESLRPDMVGICSPTALHYEHMRLCFNCGVKILWLEKPITQELQHAVHLGELARQKKATVCVNYFRRYLPQYIKLRDIHQTASFGQTRLIRILYSPNLSSNGVHLLDQLFFLTGATNYELLWADPRALPDNPAFALRLDTGLLVEGCGANLPYHTNNLSLVCDDGIISIDRGGTKVDIEKRVEKDLFPGFYELETVKPELLEPATIEGYMERSLADCLDSYEKSVEPQSSLETAILSQRLLHDILQRANQGFCRKSKGQV